MRIEKRDGINFKIINIYQIQNYSNLKLMFVALSVLFFFPLASFAQEPSEGSEAIQEIGEIILDDVQMIDVGIGVIILIIIIGAIVAATRKKSEPQSYKYKDV